MFGRLSHTRLLRYAGLFTWAMVGVPLVYSQYVPADGGEELVADGARALWLFACYLGFGACYWWLTRGLGRAVASWLDRALLLLYLDERPQREIAEILGISEANVSTKIGRLKQRLRDEL